MRDINDIISEAIEEENGVYSGFFSEEEAEAFAKEKGIAEYTIEQMGDDDTYTLYDDDAGNEEDEEEVEYEEWWSQAYHCWVRLPK